MVVVIAIERYLVGGESDIVQPLDSDFEFDFCCGGFYVEIAFNIEFDVLVDRAAGEYKFWFDVTRFDDTGSDRSFFAGSDGEGDRLDRQTLRFGESSNRLRVGSDYWSVGDRGDRQRSRIGNGSTCRIYAGWRDRGV